MRLLFLATIALPLAAVCINAEPIKNLNFNQYLNHGKSFLGKISSHIQRIFFKTPDFCNGLECPKFEVKKKTSSYELRCYPAYKWAGTAVEGPSKPQRRMFMRLFNYISGDNKAKKKIDMTVPVATKVELAKGENKTNRYTMLFFVPFEYQKSPPQPTNPLVSIITLGPVCAYVRSYGGYSWDAKEKYNVRKLIKSLEMDKIKDYTDPNEVYFTGGYDSPWKLFFRHNEVWLLQKSANRID